MNDVLEVNREGTCKNNVLGGVGFGVGVGVEVDEGDKKKEKRKAAHKAAGNLLISANYLSRNR